MKSDVGEHDKFDLLCKFHKSTENLSVQGALSHYASLLWGDESEFRRNLFKLAKESLSTVSAEHITQCTDAVGSVPEENSSSVDSPFANLCEDAFSHLLVFVDKSTNENLQAVCRYFLKMGRQVCVDPTLRNSNYMQPLSITMIAQVGFVHENKLVVELDNWPSETVFTPYNNVGTINLTQTNAGPIVGANQIRYCEKPPSRVHGSIYKLQFHRTLFKTCKKARKLVLPRDDSERRDLIATSIPLILSQYDLLPQLEKLSCQLIVGPKRDIEVLDKFIGSHPSMHTLKICAIDNLGPAHDANWGSNDLMDTLSKNKNLRCLELFMGVPEV